MEVCLDDAIKSLNLMADTLEKVETLLHWNMNMNMKSVSRYYDGKGTEYLGLTIPNKERARKTFLKRSRSLFILCALVNLVLAKNRIRMASEKKNIYSFRFPLNGH